MSHTSKFRNVKCHYFQVVSYINITGMFVVTSGLEQDTYD
jgi:hypothetical protein